jgi:mxaJ protein
MFRAALTATAVASLCLAISASSAEPRTLRVCAEPNDLPYSHRDQSGFENRIAEALARDLDARLEYAWHPQWRGFVRKTLGANRCDVLIGVPHDWHTVTTTQPYYRSSYVFVTRGDAALPNDLRDDRLRQQRVGLPLIANDLSATPPGLVLTEGRGLPENLIGFPVYGDVPAAGMIVEALGKRAIDIAIVWGAQAGFYLQRSPVAMKLAPVRAPADVEDVPFEYSIAMGVRRGNDTLRAELDAAIDRIRPQIDRILDEYGVYRTDR